MNKRFWIVSMLALLAGCVTINVYFPAAAAQAAADRIVQDVWGAQPDSRTDTDDKTGTTEPQSSLHYSVVVAANTLVRLLDVIPAAHAAGANLDISSPAIQQITASMAQRFGQMKAYFDSGAIGLTANGNVAVHDASKVPLAKRNQVNQLVAVENSDRARLYSEIADANGHPEWTGEIRKTFAQRWISRAHSGWWYQNNSGDWVQK